MAKMIADGALDAALNVVRGNCDRMVACSAQPTTYTEAVSTYALADVAMTVNTDYTLADGDIDGRKITVAAKSGVAVDAPGTINHVALVDTNTSTLTIVTTCVSQAVLVGGNVDFPAWEITLADPYLFDGFGPLRTDPNNLHITVDGNYLPVLLMGDAAWSLTSQLSNADIDTYLTDRAGRGFNFILIDIIEHLFADNAPSNIDNVSPWTGATWTTPNNTFFNRVDYAVQKAWDLSMYVLLTPLYIGFSGTEEGWDTEIAAASTGTMQTWGEYIGNRYKDFDNIIWCIGGDTDPTSFLTKVNAFVTGLRNYDTRHLITFHDGRGTQAGAHLSGATWLTLNDTYSTDVATPSLANSAYTNSTVLPFFQIEAYYEGEHSMTTQGLRAQAYWTILGGGVGHIFGNNPLWSLSYGGANWQAELNSAGSQSMTLCAALFRAFAWYNLAPDSSHALVTSGYGTIGTSDFAGAAKDSGGHLAMIYMPSNRTMTVAMSLFAGTVTARWYDPTNGSYTADAASPLANSSTHNFSRSGANNAGAADWILVLEA